MQETPTPKKPRTWRGFASMTPEQVQAAASKGGSSVAPADRAFARNPELASKAGAKGGSNGAGGLGNMCHCLTCVDSKAYWDEFGELPPSVVADMASRAAA